MGERTPTSTFTQNRLLASTSGRTGRIKFDGYRVIARKDGEQVRLWARTTSDYSCSQPGPDGGLSASAGLARQYEAGRLGT
jgi:ATP-dependent DNA ligase